MGVTRAMTDSELTAANLRKLKVGELRDECTSRSLATDGVKQVLIDRLLAYTPSATTAAEVEIDSSNSSTVAAAADVAAPAAVASPVAAVTVSPATPAPIPTPIPAASAAPTELTREISVPAPEAAPAAPVATPESLPRRTIKLNRRAPTPAEEEALLAESAAKRQRLETESNVATPALPADAAQLQQLISSLPPSTPKSVAAPKPLDVSASAASKSTPPTTPLAMRRRTSESNAAAAAGASTSLHVSGFKRPITVGQIETLLRSFGEVKAISIPFVKNLALVTFETPESAQACTTKLHGNSGFPDESHREVLSVHSIPDREVEDASHRAKAALKPTAAALAARQAQSAQVKPDRAGAALRAAEETRKREAEELATLIEEQREASAIAAAAAAAPPVAVTAGRRVITLRGRDRSGDAASSSNSMRIEKRYDEAGLNEEEERDVSMVLEDDEPPTMQLDELFRKTEFKPALYYLPCTEEEIAAKKKRAAAAAEEEKRREQQRRQRRRSYSRSRSRSRSR